jgi:ABC-type phosphonate transport system ATPase subunit
MHPYLMGEMARMRHEQLLHEAENVRRVRSARHGASAGTGPRTGLRHSVRAAIGNRLVATGWRLLETGLPHAQAIAQAAQPCDEVPC